MLIKQTSSTLQYFKSHNNYIKPKTEGNPTIVIIILSV